MKKLTGLDTPTLQGDHSDQNAFSAIFRCVCVCRGGGGGGGEGGGREGLLLRKSFASTFHPFTVHLSGANNFLSKLTLLRNIHVPV